MCVKICVYEGGPKNPEFIYLKNYVFILTCLNFSHLQSTLHLMQYTSRDVFSTVRKVLDSPISMLFGASAFCLFFHLFHISKTFPFEDCFSSGETKKKSLRARLGEKGEGIK